MAKLPKQFSVKFNRLFAETRCIERRFPELTVNDRDMAGLRESGSVSAIDYPSGSAVLPSFVSAGEKPFPGNGDLRRIVRMSDVVGRRPPYRNFESGGRVIS